MAVRREGYNPARRQRRGKRGVLLILPGASFARIDAGR